MKSTHFGNAFGAGIWCGPVIGIAGGIGWIATNSPSRRNIKSLLVLSIFVGFFCHDNDWLFLDWYFRLPQSNIWETRCNYYSMRGRLGAWGGNPRVYDYQRNA